MGTFSKDPFEAVESRIISSDEGQGVVLLFLDQGDRIAMGGEFHVKLKLH